MELCRFTLSVIQTPDFNNAFTDRPMRWNVWSKDDKAWLNTLRKVYDRNPPGPPISYFCPLVPRAQSIKAKIPRIIHHIWLGSALPKAFKRFRDQWIAQHPGWEFRLWDDDKIAAFGLKNQEAFDAAPNYGEKSDIARYEILYRMGGVYLDVDMEVRPHRSLDTLHERYALYTGISNTGTVELNNAVIGSCPQHPVIRDCIERCRTNCKAFAMQQKMLSRLQGALNATVLQQMLKSKQSGAAMGTIDRTGPAMITRAFMKYLHSSAVPTDVVALPPTYFYPLPNNLRHGGAVEQRMQTYAKPESLCMHHWAATWQKS